MVKNRRRRVVRFEDRLLGGVFDKWGPIRHAVLECGHAHNVGPTYTPKRMACSDCGPEVSK